MFIVTSNNMITIPLNLLVWAIDSLLFLATLRWVLPALTGARQGAIHAAISTLSDRLPKQATRWLSARRGQPTPAWAGWAIVVAGLLLVRHLVISLILHLSH